MSHPAAEVRRLNQLAPAYESEIGRLDARLISYYTFEALRPFVRRQATVLLMGLGNGYLAQRLAAACRRVTVVEGSRALIETIGRRAPQCRFVTALFEQYEPEVPFDLVIGSHILEHLDDPVRILRRTKQWLTKAGAAVFTVPNRWSLHRRIGTTMGLLPTVGSFNERDRALGHRRVYDTAMLERHLRAAGYRRVMIRGYWLKMVPNDKMKAWSRSLLDAIFQVSLSVPKEWCADLLAHCRR